MTSPHQLAYRPHPLADRPHPLADRTQELKVVENWRATITSTPPDTTSVSDNDEDEDTRLPSVKALLVLAYEETESLKQLHNELLLPPDTTAAGVDEIWRKVGDTKQRLEIVLSQLQSKSCELVTGKARHKRRRRNALKRRQVQERERKISSLQQATEACSKWMDDKRDKELRLKLEQSVRKAASGSLTAVQKKEQDISTSADTLTALTELRNLRHTNKKYQLPGPTLVTAQESFTSLSEKLTAILEPYGKLYKKEAHTLEVMLMEQVDSEMANQRQHSATQQDPILSYYHQAGGGLTSLVTIRQQWDTYLSHIGSSVPTKWVEPTPPTNVGWSCYLK